MRAMMARRCSAYGQTQRMRSPIRRMRTPHDLCCRGLQRGAKRLRQGAGFNGALLFESEARMPPPRTHLVVVVLDIHG